jgi:hypothetical protein
VVLKSGAAVVEGTVQDATGKPVPDATVVLVPPPNRRQNRALFHTAISDSTGKFTIRNIAPESYKLFAWKSIPNGAYYNAGFLSKYEERGRPVAVSEKTTVTEQVTVISSEP